MPHEFSDDTLGDIRIRDIQNLETYLKKKGRVTKYFEGSSDAWGFIGSRTKDIMIRIGVNIERAALDESYDIEGLMTSKGIKIEQRPYEGEDEWRSGIYIYKDNEIAGFVGLPRYDEKDLSKGFAVLCTEKI